MGRWLAVWLFTTGLAGAAEPLVTARFVPLSLASAQAQSGPAAEAGTWHVEICEWRGAPAAVHRVAILQAAPNLRYLPPEFQEALLTQRNNRNIWRVLGMAVQSGGGVAATAGIAAKSTSLAAWGSGIALAAQIAAMALRPQAEAAPVYSLPKALPELVAVPAGGCLEFNVLAARMSGAAVMGPNVIRVPEKE